MKNIITFAASMPKTILLIFVCVAFFIATSTALYAAEIRLPIHNSCCTTKSVIVFGEMWKGSLSSFKYFNFSFMPKTMKDYSAAKNSSCNVTPDCESVKRFGNSKKFSIFAVLNIQRGDNICLYATGIFYVQTLQMIYGVTPVWNVNASTASLVLSSGSVAPFFSCCHKTFFFKSYA
jgi:hypothetical protein